MKISKIIDFNFQRCKHNRGFTYDGDTREIFCKICDKEIDPVKALLIVEKQRNEMFERLIKHKFDIKQMAKRKRVKCSNCGKFTKLDFNMTWADKQRIEASDENT